LAYPAVPVVKKVYKKYERTGSWDIDVDDTGDV
jgi:hypothetical protein